MSNMYTDPSCQSMPWGSSKHPPPLKPLPPLPDIPYLTLPEPNSNDSLLSHPVPSPSLGLDIMPLYSEDESFNSSAESFSFTFSSTSRRDSASSIIKFAQSLLPPTPHSARPITPTNSVECRLQETASPSASPVSKRGATPDQLHKLCSELENLHVKRRDSAMFDTTKPRASTLRRTRTENGRCRASNLTPRPFRTGDSPVFGDSAEIEDQLHRRDRFPRHQSYQPAETSFIDWDDEVPRLTKMKKSIADLTSATRARSNSASIVPTKASLASGGTCSPRLAQSVPAAIGTNATIPKCDQHLSANRPSSPTKPCKRKPVRYRRTIFVVDSTKRLSQYSGQRKDSNGTVAPLCSVKRKRASSVSSQESRRRFGGSNKLTSWMKRIINCS